MGCPQLNIFYLLVFYQYAPQIDLVESKNEAYIPTAEEIEEMFEEHLEDVKREREQETNIKEKTAKPKLRLHRISFLERALLGYPTCFMVGSPFGVLCFLVTE